MIKCNYELCVKVVNKSNIQSKPRSIVTLPHVTITFNSQSFIFPPAIKNVNIWIHKTVILPVVLHGCETWSYRSSYEYVRRTYFLSFTFYSRKKWRDLVHGNTENNQVNWLYFLGFIDAYSAADVIYEYAIFKLRMTSFNFCLQFAVRHKFRADGKLEVVTSWFRASVALVSNWLYVLFGPPLTWRITSSVGSRIMYETD
jgi:hypothetical protein